MYQAGYIERFGTGTGEIFRLTVEAGLKEPEIDLEEGFKVVIWRPLETTDHVTDHVEELVKRLILVLSGVMSRPELMDVFELKHSANFRENYLHPAMEAGYIEMTIPSKPKSINQKYRLTKEGIALKHKLEENI